MKLAETYARVPLSFEVNQGQADPRVQFLSRGSGYSLFLTGTEAVMSLGPGVQAESLRASAPKAHRRAASSSTRNAIIRMQLLGSTPVASAVGLDEMSGKSNYFLGNDPKRWRTNIVNYGKVRFEGVYRGIDLVYYGTQRQLEYDFVVAPGADPSAIRLGFAGAEQLAIDSQGELRLHTAAGDIRWHKPTVYQEVAGVRQVVDGHYTLKGGTAVGFELGSYDPHHALVIDPVLVYSTHIGGSGDDLSKGIAVDASGNAYVTGFTTSSDFPIATGLPSTFGGNEDVFVTKFSADGSAVLYSTYLGGGSYDDGGGIAVDSAGNAYVTGLTFSANFPTANALQPAFGGVEDVFVAKLNAAGSALVYSTYLGGSNDEEGYGIAVDSTGNAYVTGYTASPDFPTANALQATFGGGADVFVTKLNPAGSALVFSTSVGGESYEYGNAIALDSAGNAYVAGTTSSPDFPTTPGAFQTTYLATVSGGEGFVTKLNAAGSALSYSTYLGSGGLRGIALDASGNAYVVGTVDDETFPTTANAFQKTHGGGGTDAVVVKLNAAGSALVYSTYLGGNGSDTGAGIAVDSSGNAYVAGYTQTNPNTGKLSTNFPLANPFQAFGGLEDGFVAEFNAAGSTLIYSSYLGGTGSERCEGIAMDALGNVYVTGETDSTDFPSVGPPQPASGGNDVFVTKIGPSAPTPVTISLIAVSPFNLAIGKGATQQFTALGTFSDGSKRDVTNIVTWQSDTPGVATITATGLASGLNYGVTLIRAVSGNISGSTPLTVSALDFSIVAAPTSLQPPSNLTSVLSLQSTNGVSEVVNLTVTGALPTGVTAALSLNHVTVPSSGTVFSSLIISTSGSPAPGTYQLLITGITAISNNTRFANVVVTIPPSTPPACCTGDYVNPAEGIPIGNTQGMSPSGKYKVETEAAPLGLASLTVKRVSDGHIVLANIQAASWGFSPDDDRFVAHWLDLSAGFGSIHQVGLYDLTRATPLVWSSSDSTHTARIQFSPSGRYLFYTDIVGGGQTQLTIVEAQTGTKRFTTSIPQSGGAPIAGQDVFGTVGWGFGPDDSRFVYGFVTGQSNVQVNLVNLQMGPAHPLVKSLSLIGQTAAYWQFSPCGDVIALVHQPGQQSVQVEIYKTNDGSSAGTGAQISSPFQSLQLHATAALHVATANGVDHPLGANTAACTAPPPPPPPAACCTGAYVNTAPGVDLAVSSGGVSPGGKYQVDPSTATGTLANVTVKRVSDGHVVLTNIQAAFWGFSPDDDRFVTHSVQDSGGASIDHVTLYDLTRATPQIPAWPGLEASTHSSRIQFSPSGRYLSYAYVGGGGKTSLTVIDARTGTVQYSDESIPSLAGAPITGEDPFGIIGWGFGPNDSRFVYAYVSAQTPQTVVQWNLVNLEKGPGHSLLRSISLNGETAAYWQFSPCGDVIALVHQPGQTGVQIEIYKTADGAPVGASVQIPKPIQSLQLHATSTSQVATNGTDDYVLGANTATCNVNVTAHSPVNIVLTDEQGHRTGLDAATGGVINEIPGGSYTGIGTEPQTITIPYVKGTYVIDAYGLDTLTSPEPYRLTVETGGASADTIDVHEMSGMASREVRQQFIFVVDDHALVTSFSPADRTPPIITPTVIGTVGASGWYASDVGVSWMVTDAESPIGSSSGCGPATVTFDTAGMTFTCTATSGGGTSSASVTIKRDITPPVIACSAPDGQWHASDTTVACTAGDAHSGLANLADASFLLSTHVAVETETSNATTDSRQVCDKAGKCAMAGPIGGNRVDRKPPTIVITSPAGSYLLGQAVATSYACTDGGSGIVSCTGTVPSGANINTAAAGVASLTVQAVDGAGNIASAAARYTVSYGVCPLYDSNSAKKSGSAYPIRIQLCDGRGNNLSSPSIVVHALRVMLIDTKEPIQVDDTGNANPDNDFRYDASLSGYIFNLSTKGFGTGSYSLSFTAGSDPVTHTVTFAVR